MSGKSKKCCYLLGLSDFICFVFGSYLLSVAVFSSCSTTACSGCCGCCAVLGLPLIALGFVIRSWAKKCCGNSNCCNSESK
jgi:hypothetical protein